MRLDRAILHNTGKDIITDYTRMTLTTTQKFTLAAASLASICFSSCNRKQLDQPKDESTGSAQVSKTDGELQGDLPPRAMKEADPKALPTDLKQKLSRLVTYLTDGETPSVEQDRFGVLSVTVNTAQGKLFVRYEKDEHGTALLTVNKFDKYGELDSRSFADVSVDGFHSIHDVMNRKREFLDSYADREKSQLSSTDKKVYARSWTAERVNEVNSAYEEEVSLLVERLSLERNLPKLIDYIKREGKEFRQDDTRDGSSSTFYRHTSVLDGQNYNFYLSEEERFPLLSIKNESKLFWFIDGGIDGYHRLADIQHEPHSGGIVDRELALTGGLVEAHTFRGWSREDIDKVNGAYAEEVERIVSELK